MHLSKEAVTAYFTYVRTHAYVTQDRRPESTVVIPEPDGVPLGLISSDPIAVRGAKVPVEFVAASGGSISGSTSQKVKKGGTCSTVKAVPDAGWKFAGWTASLGAASSSSSLSFTVPSNADANGVIVTAHFEPDEHEHEFVEVKDTRIEPTCLEYGTVKVKCTICGEVKEKELPALGHDYDKGVITLQPQPGVAGVMTYTCQRCGYIKTAPIEPLPTATPTASPTSPPSPTPAVTQTPEPVVTPEPPVVTPDPTQEPTPEPVITSEPDPTGAPEPVITAEPAPDPEPPQETEPASEAPTEVPAQEPEAPQE